MYSQRKLMKHLHGIIASLFLLFSLIGCFSLVTNASTDNLLNTWFGALSFFVPLVSLCSGVLLMLDKTNSTIYIARMVAALVLASQSVASIALLAWDGTTGDAILLGGGIIGSMTYSLFALFLPLEVSVICTTSLTSLLIAFWVGPSVCNYIQKHKKTLRELKR